MKLLVFAHTPPPHHGQSYMVKLMLDGLGGDQRRKTRARKSREEVREISESIGLGGWQMQPSAVACYHVNCRFSEDMEDIGTFRFGKALLVLRYCVEAIWCRFRYGLDAFYYVPAPGKRAALYRDWIVMLLCRPFFRHFIHHWHAVGLGDWLRREGHWLERWLTHRLLARPALAIALAIPSMRDALWFRSRRVAVIANGIPDPCPDFDAAVLPRRQARLAARRRLLAGEALSPQERECAGGDPELFRVVYLAHCIAEKGLFDSLDGVLLANNHLQAIRSPLQMHLTVAGQFLREEEERDFRSRLAAPDAAASITYAGFVSGERKNALLRESDCLCFPTYYPAESFGLVIAEAMAVGMSVVTTRWRAIPEILPVDWPGYVPPRSPQATASALQSIWICDCAALLRAAFLEKLTELSHLEALRAALSAIPPDATSTHE